MANANITALADQLFRMMENGLVIRAFVRPHPAVRIVLCRLIPVANIQTGLLS